MGVFYGIQIIPPREKKKNPYKENNHIQKFVIQKFVKPEMNYFSTHTKPTVSQKMFKYILIHTNYAFI